MIFAVFVLIAATGIWALLGLGLMCCRGIGYRPGTWAETVGIGLACLISVGGVLNLCRVSYGPVYDGLLMAGMIAAFCLAPRTAGGVFSPARIWHHVLLAALILGAIWLIGQAELPPSAFNYHDDFEKYFVHPLRMLQTGTVFGSPLSAIGAETLGGQAVLHGVAANHFAVPYLFAVDGLFALLLCLLLVAAAIPAQPRWFLLTLISVATICMINPMVINVSSTYTTCALVMTILMVCRSLYLGEAGCLRRSTLPILLGLLFAALLALKSINVFYLVTMFAFAGAVKLSGVGKNVNSPAPEMRVFATFGATVLFLLPWLLVHAPHYLAMGSAKPADGRFMTNEAPYTEPLSLFSFDQLFYGSSYAHFTLLTLTVVVYCIGLYLLLRHPDEDRRLARGWLLASAAALPVSAVLILALGPQLNGYFANIRYAMPLLIVGSSILLPVTVIETRKLHGRAATFLITGLALCGVSVLALFSEGFVSRIRQASSFGNSLAFSGLATSSEYMAYNQEVLYGRVAEQMRRIQGTIPAGAAVLAWVTTPYDFDFSRNLLFDVDQAGTANPWARIPKADYVIYQYAGYAVPSLDVLQEDLRHPGRRERIVGMNALAVIEAIENLWRRGVELYNDGETVVFKVSNT